MAQFTDLLGRVTKIEGDTAKVREILGQMLSSPVAAPTIVNDEEKERTKRTEQIQKDIEKLSDNFEEYKSDSEKWVKDVKDAYKQQANRIVQSMRKGGGGGTALTEKGIQKAVEGALKSVIGRMGSGGDEKSSTSQFEKSLRKQEGAFTPLKRLAEAGLKPGSIHVHDRDGHNLLKNIKDALKEGSKSASPGGTGGNNGGRGPMDPGGTPGGNQYSNDWNEAVTEGDRELLSNREKKYKKWAGQIGGITAMALGGINLGQALGIEPQTISTQIKYIQNIRAIAFQTEGVTAETRTLQKEWQKFGKVAAQTGKSAAMFEEQLVDNLRRGVKSRKDAIKITKTGLQLSTMIGSNAQETASLLNEWNMTMDLSSNEMADLSRGIQDVARFTGVTGDKLMQAVKASEQFAHRMKDAGTSTSVAAKNLIMIQAAAEKIGVAESMKDLMAGLSNNADLLFKASDQTKSMLFNAAARAGVVQDAISGTVLQTRQGMKSIAEGLGSTFKSITGFDIKDIDEMPSDLKSRMNLVFESAFGMGINEFAKTAKVMQEGGKGFAERMAGIDKELQANLTTEERRSLEIKKQQLALSAGLEQSTKLAEAAKSTNTIAEAVQKMKKEAGTAWPDMKSDLLDLTKQFGMGDLTARIEAGDSKAIAQAMGLSAAKALKDAGGKDYQKEMLSAIEANDMSQIRELQAQMNEDQQKLGVETATKLDPITEAVQKLNIVNETIRNVIGGLLTGVLGAIGANGLILMTIAGTLAGAALLGPDSGILGSILTKMGVRDLVGKTLEGIGRLKNNIIDGIKTGFKGVMGTAGNAAAAAAPTVAAQAAAANAPAATANPFMDQAHDGNKRNRKQARKRAADWETGRRSAAGRQTPSPSRRGPSGGKTKGFFPKEGMKLPKMPSFKQMGQMGMQMAKGAAALAVMTVGLVALATVILKISQGILGIAGLDAGEAAKIALNVASVIMAAAAIGGAVMAAGEGLKRLGQASKYFKTAAKEMAIGAAALLIMTPAILGLGMAIVGIAKAMTAITGIDMGVAAKVAKNVGSIILAAGAISLGILGAGVGLAALGNLVWGLATATQGIGLGAAIGLMALGAATLVVLTPAIIGLATGVVHIAQGVMGAMKIDPAYAAEVTGKTGKILWSAGKIAAGVLAGAAALTGLGLLVTSINPLALAWTMFVGAAALRVLTPAIIKLSAAIVDLSAGVVSSSGVEPSYAAEVASNVGKILWSAGKIATGILLGGAALAALGALITFNGLGALAAAGWMILGASALLILTPAITKVATSVISIAQSVMANSGIDPGAAAEVASNVGNILWSAGKIATGILLGGAALAALGALVVFNGLGALAAAGLMIVGAIALRALTPAIMNVANSVITISQGVMSSMGMDPAAAVEVAKKTGDILWSAGKIAGGVLAASAALTALGAITVAGGFMGAIVAAALMYLGAKALTTLTPPIIKLAASIVQIAQEIMGAMKVDSASASKTAKTIGDVFTSAGKIAGTVLAASAALTALGPLALVAPFMIASMYVGIGVFKAMSRPVVAFMKSIGDLGKEISSIISADDGKIIQEGLTRMSNITKSIGETMDTLMDTVVPLTERSWFGFGNSPLDDLADAAEPFKSGLRSAGKLVEAAVDVVDEFKLGGAEAATKKLSKMASIIVNTGKTIDTIGKTILPLTEKKGGFWIFKSGESKFDELEKAKMPFIKGVASAAGMVQTLIDVFEGSRNPFVKFVFRLFGLPNGVNIDTGRAKGAANKLKLMSSLVKDTGQTVEDMAKTILPLVAKKDSGFWLWKKKGKSKLEKLDEAKYAFVSGVASAAGMVQMLINVFEGTKDPVVSMISKMLGLPNGLAIDEARAKSAATKMGMVAGITENAGNMLNTMINTVLPLTHRTVTYTSSWLGLVKKKKVGKSMIDKLDEAKWQFYYGVMMAAGISEMIVWSMSKVSFNPAKAEKAAYNLGVAGAITEKAGDVVKIMTDTIIPLTHRTVTYTSSWFGLVNKKKVGKSMIDKLDEAKWQFFYGVLLARGISEMIIWAMAGVSFDPGKAEKAAYNLGVAGAITQKAGEVIKMMTDTIIPITHRTVTYTSSWFGLVNKKKVGKSMIDKLDDAKGQFKDGVKLAVAISEMVIEAMAGVDFDAAKAEKAAYNLGVAGAITEKAGEVIRMMTDTILPLTHRTVTYTSHFFGLIKKKKVGQSTIDKLREAKGQFKSGVKLAVAISEMVIEAMAGVDFDAAAAEKAAYNLGVAGAITQKAGDVIKMMTETILPLTNRTVSYTYSWFGLVRKKKYDDSVIDQLMGSSVQFMFGVLLAKTISDLIINSMSGTDMDAAKAEKAAYNLGVIGAITQKAGEVMKMMTETILPLTARTVSYTGGFLGFFKQKKIGKSTIDKLAGAKEDFKMGVNAMKQIAGMVMSAVEEEGFDEARAEAASSRIESMSNVVQKVFKAIEGMQKSLSGLGKKWNLGFIGKIFGVGGYQIEGIGEMADSINSFFAEFGKIDFEMLDSIDAHVPEIKITADKITVNGMSAEAIMKGTSSGSRRAKADGADKTSTAMMASEKAHKEDVKKLADHKIKIAEDLHMSEPVKAAAAATEYGQAESNKLNKNMRKNMYDDGYRAFSEEAESTASRTKVDVEDHMDKASKLQEEMNVNMYNGMLNGIKSFWDALTGATKAGDDREKAETARLRKIGEERKKKTIAEEGLRPDDVGSIAAQNKPIADAMQDKSKEEVQAYYGSKRGEQHLAKRSEEELRMIQWAEQNKPKDVQFGPGKERLLRPKKGILAGMDDMSWETMNVERKRAYEDAALAWAKKNRPVMPPEPSKPLEDPYQQGRTTVDDSYKKGRGMVDESYKKGRVDIDEAFKAGKKKVTLPSGSGGGSFQLDEDRLILGHAGEWIHMVPEHLANAGLSNFKSTGEMMMGGGEAEPVMAESAPMSDVHNRVAQEQAGAEAGASSVSSDELVMIASASQEQVELLKKLVELQQNMKDLFGDASKKSGMTEEQKRAMTRSMTKALDTPQFYRWQYGQYGENASKDMVVMPT